MPRLAALKERIEEKEAFLAIKRFQTVTRAQRNCMEERHKSPKQTEVSPSERIRPEILRRHSLKKLLMERPQQQYLGDLTLKIGAALPCGYRKSGQT